MNKKEFAASVEAIRNKLYRTAYMYLGNEASAYEAIDEAVYKALKSLKNLRQPEYFNTWITRILINVCKDEMSRIKRLQPEENITINMNSTDEIDTDSLSLKEIISRLPEDLKEIIILRYFSGFTIAQTAVYLNMPQGTVVTKQRRALSILKLELSEEEVWRKSTSH